MTSPLRIDEDRALWFRARRSFLAGPGAAGAPAAARAILGAQAQQEGPALFALSQRTRSRPTASAVRRLLLSPRAKRLVRTWGQRDTLHLYDPADWPTFIAARREWPQSGRRGAMPTGRELATTLDVFRSAGRPLLRRELYDLIPQRYVDEVARHPYAGKQPVYFAASRLIWRLAMEGELCFAEKTGTEQRYVHRSHWLPSLDWPALDSIAAATDLTRRYLAVWGPATAADIAHFFGARVGAAREWLERLAPETSEVRCGDRRDLVILSSDRASLVSKPGTVAVWPLRLLPKWDTHLMTHADKTWVAPRETERPLVWRKAADVAAVVLVRGRIVGTWTYRTTTKLAEVTVQPLAGWRKRFAAAARREARAVAAHLELPGAVLRVEPDG